jgi:peptide/nickel transport system permease protein
MGRLSDSPMIAYLANRLFNGLLVLFGVVSLVFLIFNLKPGDPARMLADQRSSPEALAAIRQDLGVGLPWAPATCSTSTT